LLPQRVFGSGQSAVGLPDRPTTEAGQMNLAKLPFKNRREVVLNQDRYVVRVLVVDADDGEFQH
jgi:hypothetical protein